MAPKKPSSSFRLSLCAARPAYYPHPQQMYVLQISVSKWMICTSGQQTFTSRIHSGKTLGEGMVGGWEKYGQHS